MKEGRQETGEKTGKRDERQEQIEEGQEMGVGGVCGSWLWVGVEGCGGGCW